AIDHLWPIGVGQGRRFAFRWRMLKATFLLLATLAAAGSLFAQTEPQKSPALGNTPPPDLKKADKPKSEAVPPPSSTDVTAAPNSEAGKPAINKNPPPIDTADMDTSVKPADDFFMFANGSWIKRTEIPPEYSRWGSFNELIEKNNDALHEICEKVSHSQADPKTAPEVQKVGDFYASGMDEKTIDADRTKPLQDEFSRIDKIKDRSDVL